MDSIDKLERKLGRFSVENLTQYLIVGQIVAYLLITSYPQYSQMFILEGYRVLDGQWWLLLTFMFNPVSSSLLFVILMWYIFYLYGTQLERRWGSFRYMIYILISYIGMVILAFIFPNVALTNAYLYTSLFLAFAFIYPNFQLLLFFIIPVQIKWLALIAWIGILGTILLGPLATKILTLVSITNFLVFFWSDLVYEARRLLKNKSVPLAKNVNPEKAYHICAVCGDNERDNPDMQIRYCSKCMPSTCYCGDHIKSHTHVRKPN